MPLTIPERIDRFEGPFRFLSNFARLPDGSTLEHYYQAAKAVDPVQAQFVMNAPTPSHAKARGRKVKIRDDWELVKTDVMLRLLRIKFEREPFQSMLLATGTAHLEEGNWWGDTYWGTVNGKGENWLGRLLMQVRDELRDGARTNDDDEADACDR